MSLVRSEYLREEWYHLPGMAPRIPYSVIEKAAVPAGLCGDLTSLQSLRCLLLSLTAVSDMSNNLVVVECAQDSPKAGMSLVEL